MAKFTRSSRRSCQLNGLLALIITNGIDQFLSITKQMSWWCRAEP